MLTCCRVAVSPVYRNRLSLVTANPMYEFAKDLIKAVELATAETPDLIIMDIVMPKLSGLEAASQIKNNPETQGIPILAATGTGQPRKQKNDPQTVCDGYIAKPFTL